MTPQADGGRGDVLTLADSLAVHVTRQSYGFGQSTWKAQAVPGFSAHTLTVANDGEADGLLKDAVPYPAHGGKTAPRSPAAQSWSRSGPHRLAAEVATQVIAKHSHGLSEVALVIGDSAHLSTWREAAQRVAVQDDRRSKRMLRRGRKLRSTLAF